MLGVILSTSVAMANYPKYLNGDKNYILCDGIQGVAIYAIRNSLKVERYNPPNYIISIDVTENGRMTHCFAYDWETKKAWIIEDNGNWTLIDPNVTMHIIGKYADRAEMAFYLAYKKKFWGSCSENFYPTE